MAGYRRPTVTLMWTDGDMVGLEIIARRPTMGQLLALERLVPPEDVEETAEERDERTQKVVNMLAGALLDWNMESDEFDDEGQPLMLALNQAALWDLDPAALFAIRQAWIRSTAGVSPPLSKPSVDMEAGIPMEVLEPSPES